MKIENQIMQELVKIHTKNAEYNHEKIYIKISKQRDEIYTKNKIKTVICRLIFAINLI